MMVADIKKRILQMTDHVEFYYGDELCFIDPCAYDNFYLGYKNVNKNYADIDELMTDPVFDGKCLNEIAGEIEMI